MRDWLNYLCTLNSVYLQCVVKKMSFGYEMVDISSALYTLYSFFLKGCNIYENTFTFCVHITMNIG